MAYAITWKQNDTITDRLNFAVNFPGRTTGAVAVTLATTANPDRTLETAKEVKLYLTGNPEDVRLVQQKWPYLGGLSAPSAPGAQDARHLRPELDGGVEVSFNGGRSWRRFQYQLDNPDGANYGQEQDDTTWVQIPAECIGDQGADGVLTPYDQAHLLLRYVIPPAADTYHVFDVRLAVDFDIL